MKNAITIKEDSNLRFYLLNGDIIITECFVSVPILKTDYPDLWKKAQGILETFVNLCLDKWVKSYEGKYNWNVGLFDIIN